MELFIKNLKIENVEAEIFAVFMTEEKAKVFKPKTEIDNLIFSSFKDFRGEFDKMSLIFLNSKIKRVLLVGLGKEKELTLERLRIASCSAVKSAASNKIRELVFSVPATRLHSKDVAASLAEGAVLGDYVFDKYKTNHDEKQTRIEKITFLHENTKLKDIVQRAKIICEGANNARELVNEAPNVAHTVYLENVAMEIAKRNDLRITVLDENELKNRGLNLILAVSRGSFCPPRLVIIEYEGDKKSKQKIALVGKGVIFDTGGINLKPSGHIEDMKCDMAGSATVFFTIETAARLRLKKNIIAVAPLVENSIGPNSYRPGEIITAYNGKSVEISDTDAEGRLILADALSYTEKNYSPSLILDFATLTGSIMRTFGEFVAGIFGDQKTAKKIFEAGEKTYERVWHLPIYEEYKNEMKGEISDLKNLGYKEGAYAGAITGAAFLSSFVEKTPWLHFDIAGTAFYEKQRGYTPKGGTGWGIRLLIEFLK